MAQWGLTCVSCSRPDPGPCLCLCLRPWSTSVTWTVLWFGSSCDEPWGTFASLTTCSGQLSHRTLIRAMLSLPLSLALSLRTMLSLSSSDQCSLTLSLSDQYSLSLWLTMTECTLSLPFSLSLSLPLRLLKDNLQDSQFSARYQHLLAALLCCAGRGLREEFDRQCWLVSILTKVAHKVRDAALSSRQVWTQCRTFLDLGKNWNVFIIKFMAILFFLIWFDWFGVRLRFGLKRWSWPARCHVTCPCFLIGWSQCVLREGLEVMKQFFSVNSSCRLPLNPVLLVKGIHIQVLNAHTHTHTLKEGGKYWHPPHFSLHHSFTLNYH